MNNTHAESTSRFYLLAVSGIVRRVSKDTEGATLVFARDLSAAKMKYMLR